MFEQWEVIVISALVFATGMSCGIKFQERFSKETRINLIPPASEKSIPDDPKQTS